MLCKVLIEYGDKVPRGVRYGDGCIFGCYDKSTLLRLLSDARDWLKNNFGLTLHPDKVYLQEFSKGVRFIGYDIRRGRMYSSGRMIGNMTEAIRRFNDGKQIVNSFLSSINSYFGLMRHTDSYGIRWKAWRMIDNRGRFYSDRMRKISLTYRYKEHGICKINDAERRI